jgi:hypothetical protein
MRTVAINVLVLLVVDALEQGGCDLGSRCGRLLVLIATIAKRLLVFHI